MKVAFDRSALTLMSLLLSLLLLTVTPALAGTGVIEPELAAKLQSIFAPGSKPAQVTALCGEPEYAREFSTGITVWRYTSGEQYVMFAFVNGSLSQIEFLPRQVSPPGGKPAEAQPQPSNSQIIGWKPVFREPDSIFGIRLGASQTAALEILATLGAKDVTCERDQTKSTITLCTVQRLPPTWRMSADTGSNPPLIMFTFEDDRLRTAVFVISCDEKDCADPNTDLRAAFASAFDKPGKPIGRFRRSNAGAFPVLGSVFEATRWETERVESIISRGTIDITETPIPALVVTISEKDYED